LKSFLGTFGEKTMLIIRQEQLEVLRQHVTERFIERLSIHLRESFPGLTPAESLIQAQAAFDAGRRFQIMSESAVADFAVAVCRHCGGFPLPPLPRQVMATLEAVSIPAAGRIRRFRDWFVEG
jgi:hypothetical protein